MKELFNVVSYTIIETFKILDKVALELFKNPIFIIILAIVVLGIIFNILFDIVKNSKTSYTIDTTRYGNMKYSNYNPATGITTNGYKGLKNGKIVYFEVKYNRSGKVIKDGSKYVDEFLW